MQLPAPNPFPPFRSVAAVAPRRAGARGTRAAGPVRA